MTPADAADDPLFTPRTALMLLCGLGVLALAGFLAWRSSAPANPPPPSAPPPAEAPASIP